MFDVSSYKEEDYARFDMNIISIYQLFRWNEAKILKTDSPWQREFKWSPEKKSMLIESVLMGIPVQTLYLREKDGEITIIDGVQRIKTILSFLYDEFEIQSRDRRWNGLKYSQLSSIDRRKVEDFQLSVCILHNDESGEMEKRIFRILNMSREEFTSQEIRNYLYADKGIPFMDQLSQNVYFRETIANKEIDMVAHQDRELILRFMSFYYKGYKTYRGNIKKFLDATLKNYDKYQSNEKNFKSIFEEVFFTIWNVWGNDAFLIDSSKRKLNLALFDIITYSFAKCDNKDKILEKKFVIRQLLERLLNDDSEFKKAVMGASATSVHSVVSRFSIWMEALENVIGE